MSTLLKFWLNVYLDCGSSAAVTTKSPDKSAEHAEEKIRFLETQIKKLEAKVDSMKANLTQATNTVKLMYEAELAEARKLIDDLTRGKTDLEIRNQALQEQIKDNQKL